MEFEINLLAFFIPSGNVNYFTPGSKDSHGTHFVFTFSENLYLQHLNGFKWWVFIHLLHFGAHPKESRGKKRFEAWEPMMMQLLLNLLDDWFGEQFFIRLNFRPNLDWHKGEKEKNPTERPGPGSISSYQDFWHFELLSSSQPLGLLLPHLNMELAETRL